MNEATYALVVAEVRKRIPPGEQEDFVQDVFVKLLKSKPEYLSKPYIKRLVSNMIIDKHRKEIRRPSIIYDNKDYSNEGD